MLSAAIVFLAAAGCATTGSPPPPGPEYQPEIRTQVGLIRDDLYRAFRTPASCLLDPAGGLCEAIRHGWAPEVCSIRPDYGPCELYRRQIGTVEALGAQAPADAHAIGQAVFALTRSGEYDRAARLVDACAADAWWCLMLRGHLLAEQDFIVEAEAVFERMLSNMPEAELCVWTDLSAALPGPARSELRTEDCAARQARAETVWWLSDPAYMVEGNEAKTSWLSRMAWAELHDDQLEERQGGSNLSDGRGHRDEHVDELLRLGPSDVSESGAWVDAPRPTLRVVPESRALLDPFTSRPGDWPIDLDEDDFGVSVAWGVMEPLDPQVAFFERGDSLLVTAAIDLPHSPVFWGGATEGARLTLAQGPDDRVHDTASQCRYRCRWSLMAAGGRHLVSVEARSDVGVGRARFGHGLALPDSATLRVSDLLLFEPGEDLEETGLGEILPRMTGGRDWSMGDTVGIYLEVYGPSAVEDYSVSVSLESTEGGGFLRRLGQAIGLVDPGSPLRLSWMAPSDEGQIQASYSLALSDLAPGEYLLQMTFAGPGLEPASATRRIGVVAR